MSVVAVALMPSRTNAQACDLINENFDSGGNPPTGWVQNGNYFGTANPFSGSTHAGFNTLNDQLTLAPVDCPGQICFYWRASGSSSNWDVDIEWSDNSGASWNIAHTISERQRQPNHLCPNLRELASWFVFHLHRNFAALHPKQAFWWFHVFG